MGYSPSGHKESEKTEQLTHTHTHTYRVLILGFPGGSDGKESACNAGDPGSIPGQEDPREKRVAIQVMVAQL